MTTASQRKGNNFERELSAYLNDTIGLRASRAPLSGGGNVGMSGGADLLGTPGLFVEAKRVEKLSFPEAMRQAKGNVIKTNAPEVPIVINRRNRQTMGESYVVLELDGFLQFYHAWLTQQGHL